MTFEKKKKALSKLMLDYISLSKIYIVHFDNYYIFAIASSERILGKLSMKSSILKRFIYLEIPIQTRKL